MHRISKFEARYVILWKALVGTFKQEKALIRAFSGDCKIFTNLLITFV